MRSVLERARVAQRLSGPGAQRGFPPAELLPASLWSWQDAIKAVFLDRVNIVANYDKAVHSPSLRDEVAERGLAQDLS